ncbi:MAG: hypothetical protein NTZ10_02155 [Candidatus Saganbacteria bacterium]|nr:hypothetical protein [Candidatus Saganbacteria bacterium]
MTKISAKEKLEIVQSEKVAQQRERGGGWMAATAALRIGGQLGSDIFI